MIGYFLYDSRFQVSNILRFFMCLVIYDVNTILLVVNSVINLFHSQALLHVYITSLCLHLSLVFLFYQNIILTNWIPRLPTVYFGFNWHIILFMWVYPIHKPVSFILYNFISFSFVIITGSYHPYLRLNTYRPNVI